MGRKLPFDNGPSRPYDYEFPLDSPSPPPRRLCPICGEKYVKVEGEGAPCGHVRADGTTINPEPPSWTLR